MLKKFFMKSYTALYNLMICINNALIIVKVLNISN